MKKIALFFISVLFTVLVVSAKKNPGSFSVTKELKHTPVISQGSTGTCWSFATTSFLESEIMRKGFPEINLSEMYFVYYAYKNKAREYLLYHGKNNFSQGGQAHDVMNVLQEHGMVPYDDFPGETDDGRYRHRNLVNDLNKEVSAINRKRKKFDINDLKSLNSILKEHIGKVPNKVKTERGTYSPVEYREKFDINPSDYVEITSYAHHPFYKPFVLEVPDNWAHALYYNLPIDELMEVMSYSIEKGYTFCWDGDTSEKTFKHSDGEAEWDKKRAKVNQDMRQETFFDRLTTDDHLMHVVGISKNKDGQKAFYTKNSWGPDSNDFGGYLNMTMDYVRLKTIAIMVHKDAIPKKIRKKLNL